MVLGSDHEKGRKKREGKRGGGALLGFGKEKEREKKREMV
jgi:hypothetical protein